MRYLRAARSVSVKTTRLTAGAGTSENCASVLEFGRAAVDVNVEVHGCDSTVGEAT